QFFEWLPFNQGISDQVPEGDADRAAWLRSWYLDWVGGFREQFAEPLAARYGAEAAQTATAVEAFEISEYGAHADAAKLRELFPAAADA
ncbi:MAG: hypothetical protein KDA41_18695, partial [Planctomycetales bacterium]|nr:hypothetical protein [Planctomycetales bacterium]